MPSLCYLKSFSQCYPKHFPVLVFTTKIPQPFICENKITRGTNQYFFALQSLHKKRHIHLIRCATNFEQKQCAVNLCHKNHPQAFLMMSFWTYSPTWASHEPQGRENSTPGATHKLSAQSKVLFRRTTKISNCDSTSLNTSTFWRAKVLYLVGRI